MLEATDSESAAKSDNNTGLTTIAVSNASFVAKGRQKEVLGLSLKQTKEVIDLTILYDCFDE